MDGDDHGDPAGTDGVAAGADGDAASGTPTADPDGDTFGVGIHVTSEEFRFVVHVPSDIDAGWRDPEEFQRLIERVTWETLDREETLGAVGRTADPGETVTLGTVTMRPDGAVVADTLSAPVE